MSLFFSFCLSYCLFPYFTNISEDSYGLWGAVPMRMREMVWSWMVVQWSLPCVCEDRNSLRVKQCICGYHQIVLWKEYPWSLTVDSINQWILSASIMKDIVKWTVMEQISTYEITQETVSTPQWFYSIQRRQFIACISVSVFCLYQ